jgi:hypothetical protein
VKPEVWQAVAEQQTLAGELACLPAREGNADVLVVIVRSLVMMAIWTFENHMNTGLIYNSSR